MQTINLMEKGIGYLETVLDFYSGSCSYLMLYILCLVYIAIKGSDRDREIFFPSGIFLMLTAYNPIAPLILNKFFDVNNEYYRFFWIAPLVILIPYVVSEIIFDKELKAKRSLIIVLMAALFLFSGDFLYKNGIRLAENIYKMPSELIEISEKIHKDADEEYPKVFLEYEYNMQMRQYDPKILLTVDREDYLYAATNLFTEEMLKDETHPQYKIIAALIKYQYVHPEEFKKAMEETHTEYVVLDKNNLMNDFIVAAGAKKVDETEGRNIYKYPLKEKADFELVDYSVVY
ncbi:MAG: hypothetical protein K5931_06015 [Lachnospiraceae bacterium]|nr:hypothetical protein [Lachnospiraceae bacterium]